MGLHGGTIFSHEYPTISPSLLREYISQSSSTDLDRPWETHPLATSIHKSRPSWGNSYIGYKHSRIFAFPATTIYGSRPSVHKPLHSQLQPYTQTSTIHGKLICGYTNFGLDNWQQQLANYP